MIYLDTSFLTPLFREEATSSKVADFLARQPGGTLAVSKWASVEFASLISRDARTGALTGGQGRRLLAEFDAMVADALVVLMPTANDFTLAQQYVANFSTQLRAPDALHLAVAYNNRAEFVATLDNGMLFAAKKLKVPARRVIR
jgi:predicted nucleic acid-binding protein